MAVLKFKNQEGEWVTLTNYTVNPIEPVQTTGSSTKDVMSQDAVTKELDKKADKTVASGAENGLMSASMVTDLEVAKNGIYSLPDYIVGNSVDNNVFTYSNGAMGAYLKYKLKRKSVEGDYIEREVVIPWATDMDGGVFTTGYTENGRNFAVKMSSGKAYVTVPKDSVATTSSDGLMSSTDKTNLDTLVNRQLIGEFTYNIQASQGGSDYKFAMDKENSWIIANSGLTMNDSGTSATEPGTQSQVIVIGTYTLSRGFLSVETMIGMTNEDFVAVPSIDLLGKSIKITVSGLTPNSEKEFGKLKVKIYK